MNSNILRMSHITKTFPGIKALDDVNFDVKQGEIHAICGENGAGKSTLMKVLSGVWPHGSYEGIIEYEGKEVTFSNIGDSEKAGIVIIHQELALIPELSITENIFLGSEMTKHGLIDWNTAAARAKELLEMVGLDENPASKIKSIGVGKQQLVEIAKAMNKNVKLLILDEPTSALNEDDSMHLLELIRGLRDKGITCIMISHKLNEIVAVADSITILRDGKTVETLDVDDTLDEDRVIKGMVGREMTNRFPEHTPNIGEVLFEVKDWTVRHPDVAERLVCKGHNMNVRAGEIVGLAGLMGSGRTEFARSIFGKNYGVFESGQAFLAGKELKVNTVHDAIGAGVAYLTEDRKSLGFNHLEDVQHTTVSADLAKISKRGFVNHRKEHAEAQEYCEKLNTKTPNVEELVARLSGGNQQKVVLAKWLFTEPELLILDEPTRGIDVGAKYEIYGIIQQLALSGKGIIVISSELPELIGLCDRVYTMFEGEITGCLPKEELTQEDLMKLMTQSSSTTIKA